MVYPVVNAVWCAFFVFAAVLQFNDPDPVQWVVVYGLAAVLCALAVGRRLPWRPTLGYAFVAALLLVSLFAASDIGDREIRNEAFGLGLVVVWMATLGVWTRLRITSAPAP